MLLFVFPWRNQLRGISFERGSEDNFIMFWFRYVYQNRSAVENGKIDYIYKSIEKSLPTYNGVILERLYQELFIENMNIEKIKRNELISKSEKLLSKFKDYEVEYLLLEMQTLEEYL